MFLLALLLGLAQDPAPPYVKLPATVSHPVGCFIRVPAETNGTTVSWLSTSANLDIFPPDLLKDTKTAVLVGKVPGVYHVYAVSAKGDSVSKFAVCEVTVTGSLPPPTPDPVPEPTDEWYPTLKSAYLGETPSAKLKISNLASLWRQSAAALDWTTVATTGDFMTKVIQPASASLIGGDLMATRKALAAQMDKSLPTNPNQPLDAATKAQLKAAFTRAALLLDALKGVK